MTKYLTIPVASREIGGRRLGPDLLVGDLTMCVAREKHLGEAL